MSMPVVYRFAGPGVDFVTIGEVRQVDGVYVLECSATWENCAAIKLKASGMSPIAIYAMAGDQVVAVMEAAKIRAKAREGNFQKLWVLLGRVI